MTTLDRLETYRERYAALSPGWVPSTRRYQERVKELLAGNMRVLDLGCGRGGIVERLGDQGTWFGMDPDYASLASHRMPTLPRVHAQAQRLPFADASFDLVISSWVLEHVSVPQFLFHEVARVLRADGHWLFLTPNARHPIPRVSAMLTGLRRVQTSLVRHSYARDDEDTFPVCYEANTLAQVEQLAVKAGLQLGEITLVEDPSYFAFNDWTFRFALCLERCIPAKAKVHMIGHFIKPA